MNAKRSETMTVTFDGGYLTVIDDPDERHVVINIAGIADRTSQPGVAGEGPVVLEMRRGKDG
jgi:hypothetical protein